MATSLLRVGFAWTAELLAPSACASCGAPAAGPVEARAAFCPACAESVAHSPFVERLASGLPVAAAAVYGGPVARAVQRLKYEGRPEVAAPLGRWVASTVRATLGGPVDGAVLVPVPLHVTRLAERGYNQSALVAKHAARALGARCEPLGVRRAVKTREQASLDRIERLANVTHAFCASERLRGVHVVLVDDVVTTGATAEAVARAVATAGGEVLLVAAVARTPQGRRATPDSVARAARARAYTDNEEHR